MPSHHSSPPSNPRLQRTRQLTRFRRQRELTLDDREIARDCYARRADGYASRASSSLGEQGFQVLQDDMFVASAVERSPSIHAGAFLRRSVGLSSEHQRTGCPPNRVKIPRSAPLRSPLSFETLAAWFSGLDRGPAVGEFCVFSFKSLKSS